MALQDSINMVYVLKRLYGMIYIPPTQSMLTLLSVAFCGALSVGRCVELLVFNRVNNRCQ
ncbi:hypothetical protein HETIRDRAFT_414375 [Heterobasidion irregulare TC 32-1]|uniref:Uncharacterized protein n=1 Tax=Heterobasidion irregulare (strain TC 32-1) TaxID=747525 RepID=W4KHL6_HETIT|nr:uncharacterized protein HETIRDRAFT_414375 [Heterobasidion irregulare TC 32-1]ETW85343.1 hypothetical protein HETIRDRAFT_414375 [Heterobasidion irregulare TC 32-1]